MVGFLHGVTTAFARRTVILALLAALWLPALVDAATAHDCTCRSGGVSYPQGALVCIRGKLARCGMFLNNSSWTVVADACPQSRRDGPSRTPWMPMGEGRQLQAEMCRVTTTAGRRS